MAGFVPVRVIVLAVVPVLVLVLVVSAGFLVHEAIPRTISVHGIGHGLIGGEFSSTGLTSLQSVPPGRLRPYRVERECPVRSAGFKKGLFKRDEKKFAV